MLMAQPLGIIPDWQYSPDPAVNIKINPNLPIDLSVWPQGQRTVQPQGLGIARVRDLNGLGITMAQWKQPPAGVAGLGLFDSWMWENKKWLVLGGIGLLGSAALLATGVLLR